jgi:hypothetical protein
MVMMVTLYRNYAANTSVVFLAENLPVQSVPTPIASSAEDVECVRNT